LANPWGQVLFLTFQVIFVVRGFLCMDRKIQDLTP
jgi:hypothetical protein